MTGFDAAQASSSASAASSSARIRRARMTSIRPASVIKTCRVVRSTSARPTSSSSRRICCDSAGWAMCSLAAARVKLQLLGERDEVAQLAKIHKP